MSIVAMPPVGRAVERVGDRAVARSGGSSGGGASGGGARTELVAPEMALAVVAVACFWPVLFGAYIGDDLRLIVQNHSLRADDLLAVLTQPMFGREHGYWRPLTMLVLWLGQHLGPFGVHAIALAIHVVDTLAVRRIALWFVPRTPALWVAVLFAIHPVQAESVGWCAAINDPLWATLALLAARCAVRSRDAGHAGLPWRVAALGFCALLAKENGVMAVPIAWAVAGAERRALRPFAVAAAIALGSWWLLRTLALGTAAPMLPGGEPGIAATGWRAISAPAELLLRHLQVLVVPWPLSPLRPFAATIGAGAAVAWLIGMLLALAGLAALARRPGPRRAASLLVILPLLPTLVRFAAIGAHPLGDRYLYLSALGASLLVLTVPIARRPWLLAAAFAALTFAQLGVFRDQAAFAAHCRANAPEDPIVLVISGNEALTRTPPDLATADAAFALAERFAAPTPDGRAPRVLADARLGRAWCLFLQPPGAGPRSGSALVAAFQRAIDADDHNVSAWIGLGVAHGATGNAVESERALRHALSLEPTSPKAWANLANLYRQTGNQPGLRECEAHLR